MAKHKQISDVSIDDVDLDVEFTAKIGLVGNSINWAQGAIFTKTLMGNTALSFWGSPVQNRVITLLITGDYALIFPTNVVVMSGKYDGTTSNYIQIHCTKTNANELLCEYKAIIINEPTSEGEGS